MKMENITLRTKRNWN